MSRDVDQCAEEPCPDCPWRVENQTGRRRSPVKVQDHSYGWFSKANRSRLWNGLKQGERMTCHPTDPEHHENSADLKAKECAGGMILVQRELMVIDALMREGHEDTMAEYRRRRPGGLTRLGAYQLAMDATVGSVPVLGTRAMGKPNLNAEVEVGDGRLPWPPECVKIKGL